MGHTFKKQGFNKVENTIIRLITSIIFVNLSFIISSKSDFRQLSFLTGIDNLIYTIQFLSAFLVITVISYFFNRMKEDYIDVLFFLVITFTYSIVILLSDKSIYLLITVSLMFLLAIALIMDRYIEKIMNFNFSKKRLFIIITFLLISTILYLLTLVVLRYFLFKTVTFDFGIFSQMYYYMKETGIPYTTCERDQLLSHFAVHFSPVYYLFLPIYMIFPHPVTIIILQLFIVFLGVIPLYLICKGKKLNNIITFGILTAFIFYPTMRGGLFYDFHENKFLPFMLLWLLYFLDKENIKRLYKNIGIFVFLLLALMVKEDAAIYTACIGLFNIFYKTKKDEKLRGLFVFGFSVIYFFAVLVMLSKFGTGTFVGRYDNYMLNIDDGLFVMLANILKNPAYMVNQLMTAEKLEFFIWTMLPLLFIPFRQKKLTAFILFIPYIVINLMTDYSYMYNINFQYTYGSCTLLIYMAVLSFEGKKTYRNIKLAVLIAIVAIFSGVNSIADRNIYYKDYVVLKEENKELINLLENIPKKYSVRATTTYVPQLSMRREVYRYEADKITDVIVFDMRTEQNQNDYKSDIELYLKKEYKVYKEIKGKVLVLISKKVDID